jgi:hypothetical protein
MVATAVLQERETMDDVLATLATPFYALLDFALDAPAAAVALATGIGLATAALILAG